jgi:hypothetical protein
MLYCEQTGNPNPGIHLVCKFFREGDFRYRSIYGLVTQERETYLLCEFVTQGTARIRALRSSSASLQFI